MAASTGCAASIEHSSPDRPERHEVGGAHAASLEEPLLAHPLVVEHLRQVARPVVVEDDDDDIVGREVILQLQQAGHRRARGVAREDALLARDPPRHDRGVAVGHLLEVIDDAEVDVLRQEIFADALGAVRVDLAFVEDARLLVFLEHRPVGVDAPHLDRRDSAPSDTCRRR